MDIFFAYFICKGDSVNGILSWAVYPDILPLAIKQCISVITFNSEHLQSLLSVAAPLHACFQTCIDFPLFKTNQQTNDFVSGALSYPNSARNCHETV